MNVVDHMEQLAVFNKQVSDTYDRIMWDALTGNRRIEHTARLARIKELTDLSAPAIYSEPIRQVAAGMAGTGSIVADLCERTILAICGTPEPKPCPFDGHVPEPVIERDRGGHGGGPGSSGVRCPCCGVKMMGLDVMDDYGADWSGLPAAVAQWNSRP